MGPADNPGNRSSGGVPSAIVSGRNRVESAPSLLWVLHRHTAFLALLPLACLFATRSSLAEGTFFESRTGVRVPIPEGFAPTPKEAIAATNESARKAVEALFRHESESVVVSMVVVLIETDGTQALAGLPTESGPLPKAVADDLIAGMIRAAPSVREHVRTTPLLYDDTREAFGVELISFGPSLARTLLLQPDTSPDWRGVAQAGTDPTQLRCLLRTVSEAHDRGQPNLAEEQAARTCGVPRKNVAAYLAEVGASAFKPRQIIERMLQVVTGRGTTLIKFDAEMAGRETLDAAWTTTWRGLRAPPSTRRKEAAADIFTSRASNGGLSIGPREVLTAAIVLLLIVGYIMVARRGLQKARQNLESEIAPSTLQMLVSALWVLWALAAVVRAAVLGERDVVAIAISAVMAFYSTRWLLTVLKARKRAGA